MKLNRKILTITISILFFSLLISSIVNIINFRKNYTEALITGSYGLGYSLNSIVTELLNLGLPLDSFSGMDKKCRQLIEQNPHISYVCIHDLTGKALYHSDPALVDSVFTDEVMKKSIAATKPLTQLYHRFDGHEYYDVSVPVVTAGNTHVGVIRLGFRTRVINDKVVSAIVQVVINVAISFVIIALMINYFMSRFVSEPVIRLSEHAHKIADGNYDIEADVISHDEVGALSEALNQMSGTIKKQMDELKKSRDDLEKRVVERTKELDIANNELNEELLERKRAEQALRKANSAIERQLRFTETLLGAIPIAAFYKDTEGRYLGCNKEFAKIMGITPEDIVGKTVFDVWPGEQAHTYHQKYMELLQNPAYQIYEYKVADYEGKTLDVIYYKDVFRDENGLVSGIIGTFVDITERKKIEADLRMKQQQLEELNATLEQRVQEEISSRQEKEQLLFQQSRMAAMGEMIGAIAHQWRQPLNDIGLIIQNLQMAFEYGELNSERLKNAVSSGMWQVNFMSKTIDDFRNFFKPSKAKEIFDVRKVVDETISLMKAQLQNNYIDVEIIAEKEGLVITGYPNEFKHVLLNLINNAKDAILVRKAKENCQTKITIQISEKADKVILKIRDTGGGIPENIMNKIFDPYFTTKDEGTGTGIGLYISKTMIERNMGGQLTAQNGKEGAEFMIEV